jgi:hypothetical protein
MDNDTLKLILRTFASVFEHVTLWRTLPGDILILGSSSPIDLNVSSVIERFNLDEVREDLQRIPITNLPTLFSLQIASGHTVRKMAGRGWLNEDYYPILEYEAPKAFFLGSVADVIQSHDELNRSTQDWYTQAATFACSSAAIFSTAAVIAGS